MSKAFGHRGVSFYNVLSREPHPGFYGFTQPDSLEMRQEYVRLASAELQLDIPWIIDDMDNTLQKTYGGMPNMEFVIDRDGTLLASWDWAKPEELKRLLEERLGPSGITPEEWAKLADQPGMAVSVADSDEVPATEVPRQSLAPLKIKDVSSQEAPFLLEAGTLPPKVTPAGLSRLYLTITPDETSKAFFDNGVAAEILLEDAHGIQLQKDKIVAGKSRSGQDIYPHTVGVMWTPNEGAENLEFTATVKATMGQAGDQAKKEWTRAFRVYGSIPTLDKSMDEILPDKLPAKDKLGILECRQTSEDAVPYTVEASIYNEPAHPGQGLVYLTLRVDGGSGYVWNNLASPPQINLRSLSGVELEKNSLRAGDREGEEDTDPRILAFWWKKESGAKEFVVEVTPDVWICNNDEGWCRRFGGTFRISAKLPE